MGFLCHVFDHKRSASLADFDYVHRCWVSECERCFAILVREGPGDWREVVFDEPAAKPARVGSLNSAGFTIFDQASARHAQVGSLSSIGFTIVAGGPEAIS